MRKFTHRRAFSMASANYSSVFNQ